MTLNERRGSSISKLHDEILWYIFRFNSYPTNLSAENGPRYTFFVHPNVVPLRPVPPLVTNRRTSQVCRQWRRVMLHAASIWANGFDLRYLNQRGDDWRREVLIRTGEAPLTVFGPVGDPDGASDSVIQNMCAVPFVLDLLEAHWKRIQTLIICSASATIDQKLCDLWSRPAPNLMKFAVAFENNYNLKRAIPFMNHAPNLRMLHTDGLLFSFSQPSWSSNIRHLDITWATEGISIPELLHGLESMTSLEVLRFCDIDADTDAVQPIDVGHPMIKLPALRSFTMQDSDSLAPALLSRIIIPPKCTFYADSTIDDFGVEEISERIAPVYATFFKNNFSQPPLKHLTYSLQYTNTNDVEDVLDDEPDDMYMLEISFGTGRHKKPRFRYTAILEGVSSTAFRMAKALLSCDLSNVTTLSLSLNVHHPESITEHPLFQSMYDFLVSLESVKTLHTDEETLKLYMASGKLYDYYVFFRPLDTVYTDLWDTGIVEFLAYRRGNSDTPDKQYPINRIERLFFSKGSPVPREDSTDIGMAAMMGLRLGREGHDD